VVGVEHFIFKKVLLKSFISIYNPDIINYKLDRTCLNISFSISLCLALHGHVYNCVWMRMIVWKTSLLSFHLD